MSDVPIKGLSDEAFSEYFVTMGEEMIAFLRAKYARPGKGYVALMAGIVAIYSQMGAEDDFRERMRASTLELLAIFDKIDRRGRA